MTRNKKLVRLMALTVATTTVATAVPAYAAFDADYYAKQNPDVVAVVGTTPKALENHYNLFGKNEGRAASAEEANGSELRQIFDAKLYAQLYPDVVAVYGTDADKLFQHFLTFGINEGRKVNNYFDVKAYKDAYPDLQNAFGDNIAAYYKHFATFGIKEHRTAGGFPAENILPGGAKKTTVVASSGGGGGSSDGGASGGGAGGGSVTPAPSKIPNISPEQAAVNSQVAAAEASLAKASSPNATTQDKLDAVNATSKALDAATEQKKATAKDLTDAGTEKAKADAALSKAQGKFTKYATFKTEVDAVGDAMHNVNDADKALKEAEIVAAEKTNEYTKAQAAYNNAVTAYNSAYNAAVAAVNTAGKDGYIDLETTPLTDAASVKAALTNAKTEIQKDMQAANKDKKIAELKNLAVGVGKVSDYLNADGSVNTTKQQNAVAEAQTEAVNALKESYLAQRVTALAEKESLTADEVAELKALFGDSVIKDGSVDTTKVATPDKIKEVAPNVADSKLSASDVDTAKTNAADAINKPINDYVVALKRDAVDKANTNLGDAEEVAFDQDNGALKALSDAKDGMNTAKGQVRAKETAKEGAEDALDAAIETRDKAIKDAEPALTDAEKAEANAYYEAQKEVAKAEADVNNAKIADAEAQKAVEVATDNYADAVALITPEP